MPAQRETPAQARVHPCRRVVRLFKHVEDAGVHVWRHPHAVVPDGDQHRRRLGREGHLDASPAWRVLTGVVEQVGEHLHQSNGIAIHANGFPGQIQRKRQSLPLGEAFRVLHRSGNQIAHVQWFQVQRELAGGCA
ncbi:hypothetical protein D9M68_832520 [compost metagenome]